MENQEKKNLHEQIEKLICIKKEELYELKIMSKMLIKAVTEYKTFEKFEESFPNLKELIKLDEEIIKILSWRNKEN